jgi:hypothetical protein
MWAKRPGILWQWKTSWKQWFSSETKELTEMREHQQEEEKKRYEDVKENKNTFAARWLTFNLCVLNIGSHWNVAQYPDMRMTPVTL